MKENAEPRAPVRRRLRYAILLLGLPLTLGAGGDSWKTKLPAQWTQEEALAVLTDSPWAVRVELQQATGRLLARFADDSRAVYQAGPKQAPRIFSLPPVAIEPEVVRAVYAVRWSSAATVQQALARLEEISPAVKEMQAPPPDLSAEHYVLTARVVTPPAESAVQEMDRERARLVDEMDRPIYDEAPQVSDLFAGLKEEELRARALLRMAGGRELPPERVVRHGLGASEGMSFFFPRLVTGQPTVLAGTAWAEFVFTSARGEKLKARFKLREMQLHGQADY